MLKSARNKIFIITAIVALLVALYAIGGFWLAPRLIRSSLMEQIPKSLVGVTPTVGRIRVNPFLLQLEVKDFILTGSQGTKLVGFERFFVDFELSSIWHRAYSFKAIALDAPFANAVIFKNGHLNLEQLQPTTPAKPAPKKSEGVPALRIDSFMVSRGLLAFDDRRRPSDFTTRLEPLNFELQNFTTGVDGGRFTFSAVSKNDEHLEWHGHLSVQPLASDGEFKIAGLQAHTIWQYLEDQLSFAVNSGKIDLQATYKFSLQDDVSLQIDIPKVALKDLTVRLKGADSDWVTLPELLLAGTTFDLQKREAHADDLTLDGLKITAWREADGSINLLQLAAAPAAASPVPANGATPTVTSAGPSTNRPWTFSLREFALSDADISAEDRGTRPAVKVVLAPLSLKVEGLSLDLAKPLKVALDTKINEKGSLSATGQVTVQPVTADLLLKLAGIELPVLQPYIAQYTSMTLRDGALSGDAKVHYGPKQVNFAGNLSVANLRTVDNALHDDFINWERLDVRGIKLQQNPDRLDIEEILARKPYARVIIEPDQTINVKRVLAAPGATVVAPAGKSGATVAVAAAPAPAVPAARARKGKKPAQTELAGGAPVQAASGMPMSIKKIALQEGTANFTDLSLQPNFSTGIQKLQGTILGLSSNPKSRAKIDIHGSVDAFAPVAITGEVNVLGPKLYTDLSLSFSNIELSTFNPYSGKFAGYNISKGKLTTELHYKIDGRKLDAQHHVVIDQLEFGDKTESKQAVSLPIKLAVALLKDRQGVIDLNVPVTGSLDDPKFRLGPIIWKVFVNILEKAVTAPFALLGSLFGGGPDLQFVDFQPGSADLDSAATDKAKAIVKALESRPQLKIEIPIAAIKDIDGPRLVDVKFQAELRAAQAAAGSRKKSAAVPFEQMGPPARLEILTKLYTQDFGSEPKFPDSVGSIKPKPDLLAAKIDYLTQELHSHKSVNESDLTELGEQRAMNLQTLLLTGTQIDPSRVFLVANGKAKNEGGAARLELTLR